MGMKDRWDNFIKLYKLAPFSAKGNFLTGLFFVTILVIFVVFGPYIVPYNPLKMSDDELAPPSLKYFMGTDVLGRDLFSRMVVGTRFSLGASFFATLIGLMIGLLLGSSSGFFGGKLDRLLMLFMDALYVFPNFILMLIMAIVLGQGIWQSAVAIAIAGIPGRFRMIRSLTISVKERGFIEAERVLGASNWHIIRHHIAPYYLSVLFVQISLGMARGTLALAGLGFLGLGIPPPTPDWGAELNAGRPFYLSGHWWLVIFPGVFVLMAMIGFNLLSEGLDTILNPTMRRLQK
jgi:peptide/nickel transport system permease protein